MPVLGGPEEEAARPRFPASWLHPMTWPERVEVDRIAVAIPPRVPRSWGTRLGLHSTACSANPGPTLIPAIWPALLIATAQLHCRRVTAWQQRQVHDGRSRRDERAAAAIRVLLRVPDDRAGVVDVVPHLAVAAAGDPDRRAARRPAIGFRVSALIARKPERASGYLAGSVQPARVAAGLAFRRESRWGRSSVPTPPVSSSSGLARRGSHARDRTRSENHPGTRVRGSPPALRRCAPAGGA